jgi:hypothetical protein
MATIHLRSKAMKRHSTPSFTIQDFEQAADSLTRIMFTLTEQHGSATYKLKKYPDATLLSLQSAALSVHASIKSFIAIERMNNQ